MGLFGSLFTGVSALFAQSQNTAIVSNNIANINTTGFKRSEGSFNSLVTSQGRLARYSPGTVTVSRVQRVSQQGALQQTSSATDGAISGNGLFAVKRSDDFGQEFLYTRAGQFSEDSQGILRNASGFILYAWPIDSEGELPADQGDLTSLVPANVAFLGGLTRPTTTAEIAINLDADETELNMGTIVGGAQDGTTGFIGFPVPTTEPASFSRGLTVFDSLGSDQTLTFEYRKIDGPMAKARSESSTTLSRDTTLVGIGTIAAGNTFTFQVTGTASIEYIIGAAAGAGQFRIDTLGDLIDHINDTYGSGAEAFAKITEDDELVIKAINTTDSITLQDTAGTALFGATNLNVFNDGAGATVYDPINVVYAVATAQDTNNDPYGYVTPGTAASPNNQADFPDFANVTNPNTEGWWEIKVIHPDGRTLTEGLINFDSDGALNASADADGIIDIEVSDVDWGNGSTAQDISVDIERFSQFSGNFDVIFSDQNGAELGLRTGVELTREGVIVAQFSNGASADLYKVPLVTFANVNGLTEISGTAYTEAEESGTNNLREAGSGGAGFVEPSTLESSNVDLADEFAKLIVSQRAFGAGTRLINTVDQMTEDLLRLR